MTNNVFSKTERAVLTALAGFAFGTLAGLLFAWHIVNSVGLPA